MSTPENTHYPIPVEHSEACAYQSEGIVSAAEKNFGVALLASRVRMLSPVGPGTWPNKFMMPKHGRKIWGWTNATVIRADVKLDARQATKWLPGTLLTLDGDWATVFIAWYPDSFCCGPYHEAGILLPVKYNNVSAMFCPWMLVDSDTSLIAGREILGFPKKLGTFTFNITNPATSVVATASADRTDASPLDEPGLVARGVRVEASVSRGGETLLSIAGQLGEDIAVRTATVLPDTVFLNAQTNHPLPVAGAACAIGNRPRLNQFRIAEGPISVWDVEGVTVTIGATQHDNLLPAFESATPEARGGQWGVTNFYSGREALNQLGPEIAGSFTEHDLVYALRNL